MTKHQTFVIQALEARRSDDLFRARRRFQNHTPAQMAERYGGHGQTCAEVLRDYEEHEAAIDAAIEWVTQLGELRSPEALAQKLRDAISMAGYYGEPFGCALMAQAADEIDRQAGGPNALTERAECAKIAREFAWYEADGCSPEESNERIAALIERQPEGHSEAQYKIVIEERVDLLEKSVQQCMKEGWLPLGGASVCVTSDGRGGDSWLHQQAMTR